MPHRQREIVASLVSATIREANGGQYPTTIWQWRRVARKFGCRLRFVPCELLSEPFLRHSPRVAYIPADRRCARLYGYLMHEIAEAALMWEGREPCVCYTATRHEIAQDLEQL